MSRPATASPSASVRPEYLRIGDGESRIRATVESAEFLGETTRITLDWGGRDLVVRTRDPLLARSSSASIRQTRT